VEFAGIENNIDYFVDVGMSTNTHSLRIHRSESHCVIRTFKKDLIIGFEFTRSWKAKNSGDDDTCI